MKIYEEELFKPLSQRVVKANQLIQKAHFNLSTQQQKIVLYLISKIEPTDTELQEYCFSIREFCEVAGIDCTSGKNYETIKKQIQKIADKSMWLKFENSERLVRWIQKAKIEDNNGIITIKLDEDLKPYLLELKKNYTSYEFIYILKLKSKYSIRLFEFVHSIHYNALKPYTNSYAVEQLKEVLGVPTSYSYSQFRADIFDKAINEVNQKTDKTITYRPIKKANKVIAIELTVTTKEIIERDYIFEETYKQIKSANFKTEVTEPQAVEPKQNKKEITVTEAKVEEKEEVVEPQAVEPQKKNTFSRFKKFFKNKIEGFN